MWSNQLLGKSLDQLVFERTSQVTAETSPPPRRSEIHLLQTSSRRGLSNHCRLLWPSPLYVPRSPESIRSRPPNSQASNHKQGCHGFTHPVEHDAEVLASSHAFGIKCHRRNTTAACFRGHYVLKCRANKEIHAPSLPSSSWVRKTHDEATAGQKSQRRGIVPLSRGKKTMSSGRRCVFKPRVLRIAQMHLRHRTWIGCGFKWRFLSGSEFGRDRLLAKLLPQPRTLLYVRIFIFGVCKRDQVVWANVAPYTNTHHDHMTYSTTRQRVKYNSSHWNLKIPPRPNHDRGTDLSIQYRIQPTQKIK